MPGPGGAGIPACTEADPPPTGETATATDGTHPTGMHSCFDNDFRYFSVHNQSRDEEVPAEQRFTGTFFHIPCSFLFLEWPFVVTNNSLKGLCH